MIFATGDTHGNFRRFSTEHFPEQRQMSRSDYVFICGDFGGVWDDSAEERYWLDWLDSKPFTTLWVDGNHENYDMLHRLPVEEWHGGKVQRVRPNILHLMRGQLYVIDGYTFYTLGGARSHDIKDGILDPEAPDFKKVCRQLRVRNALFRIRHKDWWPEELPSTAEYMEALRTLERTEWAVDYVITHCAPARIAKELIPTHEPDPLTAFLDMINRRLKFHYWLFGHYHGNQIIQNKYVLLWEQIVQII